VPVADEVRKLAERTGRATGEIGRMIRRHRGRRQDVTLRVKMKMTAGDVRRPPPRDRRNLTRTCDVLY